MHIYLRALTLMFFVTGCGKGYRTAKYLGLDQESLNTPITIEEPAEEAFTKANVVISGQCKSGVKVDVSGSGVAKIHQVDCVSGRFTADVELTDSDGLKNVVVAQDRANQSRAVFSRSFNRDATAPTVELTLPAADTAAKLGVAVSGSCENGLPLQIYGSGAAATASLVCAGGAFSADVMFSANDGEKLINFAQTDLAGNLTAISRRFFRDNTAPILQVTAPAAAMVLIQSTFNVTGTCETGLPVDLSGAGLASPVSGACTNGAFSIAAVLSAVDGNKTFEVSQTDAAQNKTAITRTVERRTTGPTITILQPAAGTVAQNGVTLQGSCTGNFTVAISGGGVNANSTTTCAGGAFSAPITFSAGDGQKNVIVTQTDTFTLSGSDSRSFVKDSTAPTLTITAPSANSYALNNIEIRGVCETGIAIQLSGTGLNQASTATCANSLFTTTVALSSGDGNKSIDLRQTDSVGNSTVRTLVVVRDTTAPRVTITDPAAGTIAESEITLRGACEPGLSVNIRGTGALAPVAASCDGGTYATTVVFSAGDGLKAIEARQTDGAGNSTVVNREFVRGRVINTLDGTLLYAQRCASCHGQLAASTKKGRTSTQIKSAIATIPAMAALSVLTPAEVEAISIALGGDASTEICIAQTDPGRLGIHRLNRDEYGLTVKSLLGISTNPGENLPAENTAFGFNNIAALLSVTSVSIDRYLEAAETAVNQAFTANAAQIFNCNGQAVNPATLTRACAEQILTRIGDQALRRAMTPVERTQIFGFINSASTEGLALSEGVRWGLEWLLITPSFLYRVINHPAPNDPNVVISLTGNELATRMSYLLWSRHPDTELRTLAASNAILQPATLEAQVNRMLADPQAQALIDQFAAQWLELHKFEMQSIDTTVFSFSEVLRQDMKTETNMLLRDVLLGNRGTLALINSDTTYVNRRLAMHYGLPPPASDTVFVSTSTATTERRGVIGQGSVLVGTSLPQRTSVVRRGQWILSNILCEPPPPPPPDVGDGLGGDPGGNLKEKMAAHRNNPVCASCHNIIDPIGFALENFDANATFRTRYRDGTAVDTVGTLPNGQVVRGALDLSKILEADPRYRACVTKKLMTYALGRGLESADQCTVNRLSRDTVGPNIPFNTLIKGILNSDPFRKQRGGL